MIPRRETVIGHGAHARRCIAWCGLLIDSHNLEVLVDYTRYAGDWAREAVTVPGRAGSGLKTPSPFSRLDRRVVAYLRPKCTALLYDHSVNSPRTARLNVYQSFLLAAIKTHCFIAAASEHPSAKTKTSFKTGHDAAGGKRKKVLASRGPSPAAVHAAITAGIRYMEGAVRHHAAVARATLGATGRIQRTHVRYLGLHAFAKIFSRKQSRHAGTLALLKRDMGAATMRAAAKKLAPVVDDARSTTFDQIRF
jgi:telomerase reverse transcriptase